MTLFARHPQHTLNTLKNTLIYLPHLLYLFAMSARGRVYHGIGVVVLVVP
jgi:hypothetical protein